MAARTVGLVAPLPPQVGGVAGFAEWLLAREQEIGCRFDAFDLWRPATGEVGGRMSLDAVGIQARLLPRFLRWSRKAPESSTTPSRTPPRASRATCSSSPFSRRAGIGSRPHPRVPEGSPGERGPCASRPSRRSLGDALAVVRAGTRGARHRGRLDPQSDSNRPERPRPMPQAALSASSSSAATANARAAPS